MAISSTALFQQYERARAEWPWLHYVEKINGLPKYTLFAIASRETNMRNILGDGGHGVGIFQRDDRAFAGMKTPVGTLSTKAGKDWYLLHPRQQADDAAALHKGNLKVFSGIESRALAAYNAGAGGVQRALNRGWHPDRATTGGDYSQDVLDRRRRLAAKYK